MGGCSSRGVTNSNVRVLLMLYTYNTISIHLIKLKSYNSFLFLNSIALMVQTCEIMKLLYFKVEQFRAVIQNVRK